MQVLTESQRNPEDITEANHNSMSNIFQIKVSIWNSYIGFLVD